MSADVEARLSDLEARVGRLESTARTHPPARVSSSSGEKLSPREFLLDRAPKSDNDKWLTAVHYLELVGGADSVNYDDIDTFLGSAKEALPANRRDPPYQNVKKGYVREVGKREKGKTARNRWALTNLGIARVESGFKGR